MAIRPGTHRRSGNAVYSASERIGWKPRIIVQVGVGMLCKEVDIFHEEWPDVEMIGFDPHPKAFKTMAGRYPGTLICAAVGKENRASVPFYMRPNHQEGSSVLHIDPNKTTIQISVPMVSLDSALEHIVGSPSIDKDVMLWLDCEGIELDVLQGAERLIDRVGVINVEMTGIPQAERWSSPEDIHALLKAAGFYQIWVHTMRAHIGQYDAIYVEKSLFCPVYCFIPEEIARWRKDTGR